MSIDELMKLGPYLATIAIIVLAFLTFIYKYSQLITTSQAERDKLFLQSAADRDKVFTQWLSDHDAIFVGIMQRVDGFLDDLAKEVSRNTEVMVAHNAETKAILKTIKDGNGNGNGNSRKSR